LLLINSHLTAANVSKQKKSLAKALLQPKINSDRKARGQKQGGEVQGQNRVKSPIAFKTG